MEKQVKIPWDDWTLVKSIGEGGFGRVYEIQRTQHGITEKAAMKVLSIPQSSAEIENLQIEGYTDDGITQRFSRFADDIIKEYGMMVQMKGNANIVYCDDYKAIQHDDGFGWDIYIKMELLTPLMKVVQQVTTEDQIIRLGLDICNALVVCQRRNVIHRDIKPQNVFISEDGVYKLGDFGIARTAERTTRGTVGIGTYQFMAPEVKNDQQYNATVDIYSLGLMLHWLLNERRSPFLPLPPAIPRHGEDEIARQRRFAGEPIPAPKNGSEALKAIILKACAFDPKDRYQSAAEMLKALSALKAGATPVAEPIVANLSKDISPVANVEADEDLTIGPSWSNTNSTHRPATNPEDETELTVGPTWSNIHGERLSDNLTVGPDWKGTTAQVPQENEKIKSNDLSKVKTSVEREALEAVPGKPKRKKWIVLLAVIIIVAIAAVGLTIRKGQSTITIIQQPEDMGGWLTDTVSTRVVAVGEGLEYQWWKAPAGESYSIVEGAQTDTYTDILEEYCPNQYVVCVIRDEYGNQVTTEPARVSMSWSAKNTSSSDIQMESEDDITIDSESTDMQTEQTKLADTFTIAFVPKVVGQAWWDYVGKGVTTWATEHPEVEVIYKGPRVVDAAAQVQIMTDLVNQGVDALLFSPNDPNACEEICRQARDAGIIVISTEAPTMTHVDYNIEAFNDAGLGAFLMDELARQMGKEGEYITMVGSMTMKSHNNWADAAVARAKEAYPNMTLVADARVSSESDVEVAYNKVKELKQKYPNLKGILGTSSFDAPGAARAIDEMGLTGEMFAISVAMPSETRDYLKSGVLTAVGLWDPAATAQAMLSLAVDMLSGATITSGHDLGIAGYESVTIYGSLIIGKGALAITAENVDKFSF